VIDSFEPSMPATASNGPVCNLPDPADSLSHV
jgi:hypothetical protein